MVASSQSNFVLPWCFFFPTPQRKGIPQLIYALPVLLDLVSDLVSLRLQGLSSFDVAISMISSITVCRVECKHVVLKIVALPTTIHLPSKAKCQKRWFAWCNNNALKLFIDCLSNYCVLIPAGLIICICTFDSCWFR